MNPWAFLVVLIAVGLIVIGFKGSQDNFIAALTGKKYKNSTLI